MEDLIVEKADTVAGSSMHKRADKELVLEMWARRPRFVKSCSANQAKENWRKNQNASRNPDFDDVEAPWQVAGAELLEPGVGAAFDERLFGSAHGVERADSVL